MAKGNPHKMHGGYKRHQERIPSTIIIFRAHNEEVRRIHELCLDEMEADETHDGSDSDECEGEVEEINLDLCDFGHDAFELFDGDFALLPEDAWQANDLIDPSDRGFGTLRHNMEDIKPDEIFLQDTKWIAKKYSLLTAMVIGGVFSEELLNDSTAIVGRYQIAFEESLTELGIEFRPSMGITERGWENYNKFHSHATVISTGHC